VVILALVLFRDLLFRDRILGFRDAIHHFYPLDARVLEEWRSGRIPLWDPWQNGGVPLLGNPTAAVFYPGKLLFHLLPFAWATRIYVIIHVVLAAWGMRRLLRQWGMGPSARSIGALAYAFGGPVFLLQNNVIYLVGAAWIPWTLESSSRMFRSGALGSILAVATCLSMSVLGGDPEAAYICVVIAAAEAWVRSRRDAIANETVPGSRRAPSAVRLVLLLTALLAVSFSLVAVLPSYRAALRASPILALLDRPVRLAAFLAVGLLLVARPRGLRARLSPRLAKLGAAALLASLISLVQVLPTAEFLWSSARISGSLGTDRYAFSLVPYRLIEALLPGVLGSPYPENRSWRNVLPPASDPTFWVPSLYLGVLPVVLCVVGFLRPPRWPDARRSIRWLVAVALLGSFGLYASPQGVWRWLDPAHSQLERRDSTQQLESSSELDLRVSDGSFYSLICLCLPGFELFRYPSKLLPIATLAASALAALGWDQMSRATTRTGVAVSVATASSCLILTVLWLTSKDWMIEHAGHAGRLSLTSGPFQADSAWGDLLRSLIHASLASVAVGAVISLAPRRPRLARTLAISLLVVDFAIAQSPFVWTVSRSLTDRPPLLADEIAAAESQLPSEGPFRIHRPVLWYPRAWAADSSPDRLTQLAVWERDTLMPLHGLPENLSYTLALGVFDREEHVQRFSPVVRPAGELGTPFGLPVEQPILVQPRRAFDLWNTRYFILPVDPVDHRDAVRSYAAFLGDSEIIAPELALLKREGRLADWRREKDWQLLRNNAALPRAWIVHRANLVEPLDRLDPVRKEARLRAILFPAGDSSFDPRSAAWIETDHVDSKRQELGLTKPSMTEKESVNVTAYDPRRVALVATLASTGLVVLADSFAPGWDLRIDGERAPIERVNFGMRAAVVPQGLHTLVYQYEPLSFRFGACGSVLGLSVVVLGAFVSYRNSRTKCAKG
jgi:hypothetical protein